MHFHEWKVLCWGIIFTVEYAYGYDWQWFSIGLGNALAPNRRQAITWNNVDADVEDHMATQRVNTLNAEQIKTKLCLSDITYLRAASQNGASYTSSYLPYAFLPPNHVWQRFGAKVSEIMGALWCWFIELKQWILDNATDPL